MHYAEGLLDRWHPVDAAGNLLWFEGGGMPTNTVCRCSEGWRFPATTAMAHVHPQLLTMLLYLFNMLDVKLVVTPLLAYVLPRVEALYMHRLQVHTHMGLMGHVGTLAQCFVIVGVIGCMWDVDFVHAAREAQQAVDDGASQGDGSLVSVSQDKETSLGSPLEFWGREGFAEDVGRWAGVDDGTAQVFDDEFSTAVRCA